MKINGEVIYAETFTKANSGDVLQRGKQGQAAVTFKSRLLNCSGPAVLPFEYDFIIKSADNDVKDSQPQRASFLPVDCQYADLLSVFYCSYSIAVWAAAYTHHQFEMLMC